jgi:predicted polyphosphate/ATP-dependent NAD kinase
MTCKKLGLIVNPVAGIGGRVGFKGSDGQDILDRALKMGAVPESPKRTIEALKKIAFLENRIEIITYPFEMGEDEVRTCHLTPTVIGSIRKGATTAQDSKDAARDMVRSKVDLLLFAGGDGTARDIFDAVGNQLPALGIPTGVKIHSAVFAINPLYAGIMAAEYLEKAPGSIRLCESEIMDIDERAFREGKLESRLYGYLKVPCERSMIQDVKMGSVAGEEASMDAIAQDIVDNMEGDGLYIIGPGTTTRAIMNKLNLDKTLLGVDAIHHKQIAGSDLNEAQLLRLIEGKKAKIIIGVVGKQGYVFGRGNQQISPKVIRQIGRENIIILATMNKILSLDGRPLLVDTGEAEVDSMLCGYVQVITGYEERIILRVTS